MTSSYGTTVNAFITDVQANVAGASTWNVVRYKPFWYSTDAPQNLAMWFEEERQTGDRTQGSVEYHEAYVLRYWEPAVLEDPTLASSDTDQEALYVTYESLRTRADATVFQTIGAVTFAQHVGTILMGAAVGDDAYVRGFEMTVGTTRWRAFG